MNTSPRSEWEEITITERKHCHSVCNGFCILLKNRLVDIWHIVLKTIQFTHRFICFGKVRPSMWGTVMLGENCGQSSWGRLLLFPSILLTPLLSSVLFLKSKLRREEKKEKVKLIPPEKCRTGNRRLFFIVYFIYWIAMWNRIELKKRSIVSGYVLEPAPIYFLHQVTRRITVCYLMKEVYIITKHVVFSSLIRHSLFFYCFISFNKLFMYNFEFGIVNNLHWLAYSL